ncbi:MAG: hypothetical protein ABF876_06135 [Acetobacter aceti]|nr:hypothetical protein [Acetobacter aceti]
MGMDDMSNLTMRHGSYYVRFIIPKDRWADAGKVLKASTGQRKAISVP